MCVQLQTPLYICEPHRCCSMRQCKCAYCTASLMLVYSENHQAPVQLVEAICSLQTRCEMHILRSFKDTMKSFERPRTESTAYLSRLSMGCFCSNSSWFLTKKGTEDVLVRISSVKPDVRSRLNACEHTPLIVI